MRVTSFPWMNRQDAKNAKENKKREGKTFLLSCFPWRSWRLGGSSLSARRRAVQQRFAQLAQGAAAWWLEPRPFFGGLQRERIWVFWRRVLHTCHHRTQVQSWLRLAGNEPVPAIYGPSGDVKWDEADPTYSPEAAKRGG